MILIHFPLPFKVFYLFLGRKERRGKERERHINWLPFVHPLIWTCDMSSIIQHAQKRQINRIGYGLTAPGARECGGGVTANGPKDL